MRKALWENHVTIYILYRKPKDKPSIAIVHVHVYRLTKDSMQARIQAYAKHQCLQISIRQKMKI